MEKVSDHEAAAEKAVKARDEQRKLDDQEVHGKVGTGIDVPTDQASHDNWEASGESEEKALTGGWRPKHEWEGEDEDFVEAAEFNRRGELMSRISKLGRKLGDSEKLIEKLTAMVDANGKVTQKMIDDQVSDAERRLKNQRREAIRDGDFEAVDDLEESLEELKKTKDAVAKPTEVPRTDVPDLAAMTQNQRSWYDFVTGTPWVHENKELHDKLLTHASDYLDDNPTADVAEFMGEVVSKASDLRGGKSRTKPRGPDDGKGGTRQKGSARSRSSKFSGKDLNSQQRAIAAEFVEDGIIDSLDEYATMMGNEGHLDSQRGF
jgi:hypothetical protein